MAIHISLQSCPRQRPLSAPGTDPQTGRRPKILAVYTWLGPRAPPDSAPSLGPGRRILFRLGGAGRVLDCSPPAGGPGHTGRTAPRRSHSRTEVGCGDIPAPKTATTLGFCRWRTEGPRFLPTVAGRPVVLARRVDAPAGVSATAAPDRSPSPPRLGCPRRAARLHRILIALGPRRPPRSLQTPRLFAPGHRGTGAGSPRLAGASLGPRVLLRLPQQLGLRGPRSSRRRERRVFHPQLYDSGWVVAARPRLARGRPDCVAWGRSACPVWKVILWSSGFPGRPRSARALAASSACLHSLCALGIACRSGIWAAGRSFGRPPRKHGETQLETQPEGTEGTNPPVRPEPPVTPLHRDHIPRKPW